MTIANWNIRLLRTWEEIASAEFISLWSDLMDRSANAHVFFHPILVGLWLDTYRPLRDIRPLFVHAIRDKQQVIFPLVLWRRNWKNAFTRVVVPAGYSDFDYHDPLFLLAPDAEEISGFYDALRNILDTQVIYDRLLIDGLHKPYLPGFARVAHSEGCLAWSLTGVDCSTGLVFSPKKGLAQETRRRYRRLEELGLVTFRRLVPSDGKIVQDSLERMLEMHAKRWPNAYKAPGYHQRLIDEGLKAGLVDFVEMSLESIPIAWRISFTYKERYSLYMPTVDEAYFKYAPGHLSLGFALYGAVKAGMKIVDHLRGAEEYKSAWGGEETMIYDVVYDRKSLSSRLRLWACQILRHLSSFLINK